MLDILNTRTNPTASLAHLTDAQAVIEIHKLKQELQDKVVLLGHHYQQDDIIQFADFKGDSLQLAKDAAKLSNPYIIFCGVHFMAETADILTSNEQQVILPDLDAGCSMADMASINEVENAWYNIAAVTNDTVVPVTYVNCTASLKAFVGKNGGTICTSSNAKKVISWALNKGDKLLFFPDQHLGRNTCYELGVKLDEMVTYNPNLQNGGLTTEEIQKAKVILWYGYCSVHKGFHLEHIHQIRKSKPETQVIVHPECSFDVVQASDDNGSTAYIIDQVRKAPIGSSFAIGTEINLVNRLKQEMPDKEIISLSPYQCLCTTMYRVRPKWLYASLLSIKEDKPINIISVDPQIAKFAAIALERMLTI